MIVIACGMPKSGSGLLFSLVHDVIEIGTGLNSRNLKRRLFLKFILRTYNNSIGHSSWIKLVLIYCYSLLVGTFVVKTHSNLNFYMKALVKLKLAVLFYSYRDPRDVIVSLKDHGEKIKGSHPHHDFVMLSNFKNALPEVKKWSAYFYRFHRKSICTCFSYEELKNEMGNIVYLIAKRLNIHLSKEDIKVILKRYQANSENFHSKGLHFNKGVSGRFRYDLTKNQIKSANKLLAKEIRDMGYIV
ncbi:MAG: sulfotransferase domain-containing protein [Bacteroidia bacterium]